MDHPIEIAAGILGSQKALAKALGVTKAAVWQWKRKVPTSQAPEIERLTKGVVPCESLCPDVKWTRIPDPSWPCTDGRPLIDMVRTTSEH